MWANFCVKYVTTKGTIMTSKVYRSAQGKSVDLGTIILRNEHVRAVGNMNVNARGDVLDSQNHVIETKPRQIQRQNARTTNVSATPVQTSTTKARQAKKQVTAEPQQDVEDELIESSPTVLTEPPAQQEPVTVSKPVSGLAAAIARNREVKQELEKTARQRTQASGLTKL
jgi:hypothetical protein